MKIRKALRWATVGAATAATLAVPGIAAAETPSSWTENGPMPWVEVIGIYVGIPVGLFLLISVLVIAPSLVRGSGYRPGGSWYSEPLSFGPESKPVTAEAETAAAAKRRGGAGASW
ncbi:hypothetical protein [Tenggerimyces flavus]|uniref:Uncharacterized protein n=1 Tax=Tenggerimyces flavus TaxID=1708749 RepID=A0ABV7YLX9_9ACTN|nr:hypothetical protein [Tenggerimyces flavus]MBM7789503.1 hypothetical protein [Tenggerimyces flavus]